jgi:hypothetical protein
MHLPHVTDREDQELGLALRWSYSSAFGDAPTGTTSRAPAVWSLR